MQRAPLLVTILLLILLTFAWAPDAALGEGIFWAHDLRHHHLPWRAWAASEWLQGRVPWWAPGVANGFPLLADGQAGILYPPTMLLFMVLPPTLAMNASVLLHTLLAALGAWLLARAHKLGPEASLVAAIAFGFSGFLASHTVYLGMQNAVAWLPWVLWAIVARRPAWIGLAIYLMTTAGHPQAAAFGLLLSGSVALWQRQAGPFALSAFMGLLAASPQLLATLELARFGMRQGGVDAVFSNIGALPPQELVHALLPDFFGRDTPADVQQTYFHRGTNYWGQGLNHWEMSFFLGAPALVLAVLALILPAARVGEGPSPRARFFWLGAALLATLLMLGNLGLLWPLLRHVPGLDGFRFPVRFSLVLTMAVSVLAALGLDAWLRAPAEKLRRLGMGIAGAALLLLLSLSGLRLGLAAVEEPLRETLVQRYESRLEAPPPPPEIASHPLREVLFPGPEPEDPAAIPAKVENILSQLERSTTPWSPRVAWPVGMLLLTAGLVAARDRLGPRWAALGLAALLYADLYRFGADYNGRWPRAQAEAVPEALSRVDLSTRHRLSVVDRRQDETLDNQLITSSLGLLHGTRDVILTTPLLILRTELLLWKAGLDVGDKGPHKWERLAANHTIVDLLGLRYLLSVHEVRVDGMDHRATLADGRVHLYENERARPAAWLSSCVREVRPEEVEADLAGFLEGLDPDRPLVEVPEGSLGLAGCQAGSVGTVELVEDLPGRMVLKVDADRAAMLVQNDTWYPGWTARIDGEEAPLYRTLFALRGVSVPKGKHEVVLAYDPGLPARLLLLTPVLLGLLLCWGLMQDLALARRRRRTSYSSPSGTA